MQVLLKLNDDELKLMTEEEFEKMKDELDEFDGIHPYIIMGWLHDKKPICNMCNDYYFNSTIVRLKHLVTFTTTNL